MKKFAILILFSFFALNIFPALAFDDFPKEQQQQFTSWCTGAKSNSEPVCNCALKQVMHSVTPAALTTFLASNGKMSLDQASILTATAVAQALTSCAK